MPLTAGLLRDALRSTRGVWIALLALVAVGTFWNIPARTGEPASCCPRPDRQSEAAGPLQTAVIAGRLLLGRTGRVPARQGRQAGAVRLLGRGEEHRRLREGRNRPDRPRRVGADRFRPQRDLVRDILRIYFSVAHDPTELDRQGPDVGTQYRSAIFYSDASQQRIAQGYISQLDKAHAFARPIVTRVDPLKGFYPAEAYHQDFLAHNPTYPYIVINDLPKIAN